MGAPGPWALELLMLKETTGVSFSEPHGLISKFHPYLSIDPSLHVSFSILQNALIGYYFGPGPVCVHPTAEMD